MDARRRARCWTRRGVSAPGGADCAVAYDAAVDNTIKRLIADGYLGDVLSVNLVVNDKTMHPAGFVEPSAPFHWRHDRDMSGYNIMQMGIWYEAMMRWVGPAETVQALTRVHVKSRGDGNGNGQVITIPDHIEVLAEMYSGPLLHIRMSAVTGHSPQNGAWIFGTDGTLFAESPGMRCTSARATTARGLR